MVGAEAVHKMGVIPKALDGNGSIATSLITCHSFIE